MSMWLKTLLRAGLVFVIFLALLIPFYVIEYLDGGWNAITDPEFTKNIKFLLVLMFFVSVVGTIGRAMFGGKSGDRSNVSFLEWRILLLSPDFTYDAYGNCFLGATTTSCTTLATTTEPFRYTGQRFDPETGLYYYRARYYCVTIGRFCEPDPAGYAPDINWYSAFGNDPTNGTDPLGLCFASRIHPDSDSRSASSCGAAGSPPIPVPRINLARGGVAVQGADPASIAARNEITGQTPLWRVGTTLRSEATEGQYWSLTRPNLSQAEMRAFAAKHGIPAENVLSNPEGVGFLEKATIRPGGAFLSRVSPAADGAIGGGAVEIVVPPGGVTMQYWGAIVEPGVPSRGWEALQEFENASPTQRSPLPEEK